MVCKCLDSWFEMLHSFDKLIMLIIIFDRGVISQNFDSIIRSFQYQTKEKNFTLLYVLFTKSKPDPISKQIHFSHTKTLIF